MKKKKVIRENQMIDEDVIINLQGNTHDPLNTNNVNDSKEEKAFTQTNNQKSLLDAVHNHLKSREQILLFIGISAKRIPIPESFSYS